MFLCFSHFCLGYCSDSEVPD
uniref:Uncharacterized protein n=1 Tax=Anguilla anguilla TaxID=7936 RepID=A0A0E9TZI7_ANGAN